MGICREGVYEHFLVYSGHVQYVVLCTDLTKMSVIKFAEVSYMLDL